MKNIQSKNGWSQQCYIIHQILRCSWTANSLIGYGIFAKFKLIRAFIAVLLICKNEYDLFKIERIRVVTIFLLLKVYGDCLRHSRAANPIVHGLICPNLNPSKLLWLTLLPARIKKIQSKMKAPEWSQHYPSIFRCSRAAYSICGDGTLTKIKRRSI